MVKTGTIARAAFAAVLILILLAMAVGYRAFELNFGTDTSIPPAIATAAAIDAAHPSFLYGRIAVAAGTTQERLAGAGTRQEAFWGDCFSGEIPGPWVARAARTAQQEPIKIFGIEIGSGSK
jgi:hypothetical protein